MKDWFTFRAELDEARRQMTRKQGLPTWAKTAAVGLLAKVNSDASQVKSNEDPKIRDAKLASAITTTAAISTLGIAVSSQDKTLMGRAKSLARKK